MEGEEVNAIMMKKKWQIQQPNEQKVQAIMSALTIPKIVAKVLVARGFDEPQTAQEFLSVDESNVHDPFLMNGMTEAVERIKRVIEEREKILIYADYDAGATRF